MDEDESLKLGQKVFEDAPPMGGSRNNFKAIMTHRDQSTYEDLLKS